MPESNREFTSGQMSLWIRDQPEEFLIFPFPPESIEDNRDAEYDGIGRSKSHGDDGDDPINGLKTPSHLATNPRRVAFDTTFDDRAILKTPGNLGYGAAAHQAIRWLRELQAPVSGGKSAVYYPDVTGQPPVLILASFDIFECTLKSVRVTVRKLNPYKRTILAADVSLEFIQFVDDENKFTRWKGFGGGFGSEELFDDAQSNRRTKRVYGATAAAFGGVAGLLGNFTPFGSSNPVTATIGAFQSTAAATPSETFRNDFPNRSIFL